MHGPSHTRPEQAHVHLQGSHMMSPSTAGSPSLWHCWQPWPLPGRWEPRVQTRLPLLSTWQQHQHQHMLRSRHAHGHMISAGLHHAACCSVMQRTAMQGICSGLACCRCQIGLMSVPWPWTAFLAEPVLALSLAYSVWQRHMWSTCFTGIPCGP